MSYCLIYRGDFVPKEVISSVATITAKRTIQFIDWFSIDFKCGINYQSPTDPLESDFAKLIKV